MNAKKGKGKSRPNKPPNPNPPQKEELVVDENVLAEVESAQKTEDRVPEIISEVITSPVVDTTDKEEDNPKKPKRNRGKKKKHDKDDGDAQDQASEHIEDSPLEIIENVIQETPIEESVIPSARKKKNKNKKAIETEIKTSDKPESDFITPVERKPDIDDSKPQEGGDQEGKSAKKKNKKKKQRNDSERSDIKEEISCTSAFEKLLKEEKNDNKSSVIEPTTTEINKPEIPKSEELNISAYIQELEKVEDIDYVSQETKTAGKNKKKNKKDKKEPTKEIPSEMFTEISFMTAIKPVSKDEMSKTEDQMLKRDLLADVTSPSDVTKSEEDNKAKAKIAKPVDRKRKGKTDINVEEIPFEIKSELESAVKEGTSAKQDVVSVIEVIKQDEIATGVKKEDQNILVPLTLEGNIQITPKPAEKKKKGKGNKQSEDLEIKGKDHVEQDETPVTPLHETFVKGVDTFAQGDIDIMKSDVPEIAAKDIVDKKEFEKVETKAEKKRKGKKDAKNQDFLSESTTKDKELKLTESTSPALNPEDPLKLLGILREDKSKRVDSLPTPLKDTDKRKQIGADETQKPVQPKNVEQSQDPKTKEECMPQPKTKIELLPDIPIMPDPIENIQTKQEVEEPVETILITEDLKETSFINLPEIGMGKKRKKSPKPQKHDSKSRISESKLEISQDNSKTEDVKSPLQQEPTLTESAVTPVDVKTVIVEEPKVLDIVDQIITMDVQEMMDQTPFETKTKKKRKKSPKLPREQVDTKETSEPDTKEITAEMVTTVNIPILEDTTTKSIQLDKPDKKALGSEEKGNIIYDLPSDIEIRSLKADESEGSTSGFTPDIIQYPRATSQDIIDTNNNDMLIQEIALADETKLGIPLVIPDTPLVSGSGATPLETPDNILVGIRISQADVDKSKSESEKTDIKSKMMEVNQDMEELRLSIERSLAELTAIEKNEVDIEKQYEDKKTSSEMKSSEVKISMPSQIIAKTQSEKAEPTSSKKNDEKQQCQTEKPKPTKKSKEKGQSCEITPAAALDETKIVEPMVPPKISMFFDKELKDKDILIKPDIIQETISPETIHKVPEKFSETKIPTGAPIPDVQKVAEIITDTKMPPIPPMRKDNKSSSRERENKDLSIKSAVSTPTEKPIATESSKPVESISEPPAPPARKDNKNKGKNKKKGKQEPPQSTAPTQSASTTVGSTETKDASKETKKEENSAQKPESTQQKGKQQSDADIYNTDTTASNQEPTSLMASDFEPIENFEDAMTSSADDINKTFEMIADEASRSIEASHVNPEIKIVAPVEDKKKERRGEKINPASQPKNLLGHPDIPVRLNKTDYKKEKNKTPNAVLAKVKIKDSVEIEAKKQSKDTQTDNIKKFLKSKSIDESFASVTNDNDEFVYKYSFRKVFLQSACHVCKKDLKQARIPCNFCNLVFYCNAKHKDEDWPQHQGLCFAISTIVHLKDQKHIYADAQNVTGQDYRLLRMQIIVSCERVLKRRLCPWEQEALLYPRMCADVSCREWRQSKLQDCEGCGQISFCAGNPAHFPKSHQRWCKSYALYQKLVCHQQTQGRLEPKLPSKVMLEQYRISEKINEALATMYEEKIDMNDIQYATLTQIATAPLTAAYCHQTYASTSQANGTYKKPSCTIHLVGGELQFEAGALNKWETFFLHLRPQLQELRVVMVGADLNPSELPLELLGKVKLCETCRFNKRRVVFNFQDKTTYHDYRATDDFITPDIVCAFNASIKRSSIYNGKDPWPKTINCVLKQKVPFLVSSYTMSELQRDLARIKECSDVDFKMVIEPKLNSFASVRPDRNFISDDEMPLLFKNYCYALVCGVC